MRVLSLLVTAAVLLAAGCASKPEPVEETNGIKYKNSFDFVWEESLRVLRSQYKEIEAEDRTARTIKTGWDVQFHPFATFGYRTRLTVTIDGDVTEGYTVSAKEEEEINDEDVNPMTTDEASWSPRQSEGARAQKFLWDLHHRLNPSQKWRRNAER